VSFDQVGVLALNHFAVHHPAVAQVARFFAQDGPPIWVVVLLAVWFLAPGRGDRGRRAVFRAAVGAVLALAVDVVLSHAWYRPRPFVAEPHAVVALVHHAADSSFPSDHAAGSFALAVGMLGAGPGYAWLLALAAAIAVARVAVGAHWPTDALAGAAIGVLAAWVAGAWLVRPLEPLYRLALRVTGQRPREPLGP